ncbi:MAG: archaetidylinositol phosphate synthase [Candidatus Bathyarchaeota archaeon]|nr:archaetidylinositol phosphate synthase [Candidatus Bathyarchaeota archaeon]
MLTKLKKKVQDALSIEAKVAHKIGLTPNVVSIMGFVLAFLSAAAYAVYENQPLRLVVGLILLIASGFCDTLDGVMARTFNQISVFGGFLDSVLDRYADAAVYMGIIIGGLCDPVVGLIALAGSLMVSYSRARAEATGIKMETIGIAERPERIIILAASTLGAIFWVSAMNIGIIVLAVLANFTVLQRGLYFYKKCKKSKIS